MRKAKGASVTVGVVYDINRRKMFQTGVQRYRSLDVEKLVSEQSESNRKDSQKMAR